MVAPKSTITEDLTPQVDGIVSLFTVTGGPWIAGTLEVEHNGLRLREGASFDFVETTLTTFTLVFVPRVGDSVQAQFEIEDLGVGFPLVVASGREDC